MHGPIIIYTNIWSACFPQTVSAWSAFLMPLFMGSGHLPHITVPPTKACLLCATPARMDLYIKVHAWRHLPSAIPAFPKIGFFKGEHYGADQLTTNQIKKVDILSALSARQQNTEHEEISMWMKGNAVGVVTWYRANGCKEWGGFNSYCHLW